MGCPTGDNEHACIATPRYRSRTGSWSVGSGTGPARAPASVLRGGQHLDQGVHDLSGRRFRGGPGHQQPGRGRRLGQTSTGQTHAFKRALLGSTIDLGAGHPWNDTIAEGINDNSEVVGYRAAFGGHMRGFYWSPGDGFQNLSIVNPPGVEHWRDYYASAINSHGRMSAGRPKRGAWTVWRSRGGIGAQIRRCSTRHLPESRTGRTDQRLELVHGRGIHPFERGPPGISLSRRDARVPSDAGGHSQGPDHLRRERGGHGRGECDQLDHGRASAPSAGAAPARR